MERKLILYHGIVPTLDDFTEQICRAATDMRIPFLLLDVHEKGEVQLRRLQAFVADGDCAAVLFNNIGLNLTVGGASFWEAHHIPVCDILMDHPRNYDAVLRMPLKDLHFFVVDENHIPFCEEFFPEAAQVHFLPHGGNIAVDEGDIMPWEGRPTDVLLVSSCQKPLAYPAIPFFDDGGRSYYETVIGTLVQNPSLTTEEAIELFLTQHGIRLTGDDRYTLMMEYAIYAEYTVRRLFKLEIMKRLTQAGIRTDIYGADWTEPGYGTHGSMTYHEAVTPAACNALAGQAKIALNVQPWFKKGAHDRIFSAMLQGAVSVTDTSLYLSERFTDGEELVFYDLHDLSALPGKIRAVLNDTERGKAIAEKGRRRALSEDTWACRLRTMMETIGQQTAD
ncbi:MAG: glycosyltransferase family 1 protein [Lachnospiraceae bacterium]|nr:glycosyltransferase family 1 protein [Lachnospiraceae bacterium]